MNDKTPREASGDSGEMPVVDADGNEKRRKKRVIPYVEDRRNILVVTLRRTAAGRRSRCRCMYALERGIEAAFELEDSELNSELLPTGRPSAPDAVHRGRRRRRGRAAAAAVRATRPALGRRPPGPGDLPLRPRRPATTAGTPRIGRVRRAATSACCPTATSSTTPHRPARRPRSAAALRGRGRAQDRPGRVPHRSSCAAGGESDSGLEGRFLAWLKDRRPAPARRGADLRRRAAPPGPTSSTAAAAATSRCSSTAPSRAFTAVAQRDHDAEERLFDVGWDVVRFPHDADWSAIAARHARYFGVDARN